MSGAEPVPIRDTEDPMKILASSLLALAAGLAATVSAVAAEPRPGTRSAEPKRFDGTWSVRLTTLAGTCDQTTEALIAIREGRVQPMDTSAGSVSGGVGRDGRVTLDVRKAFARADVSGKLDGRAGAGVWKVEMLGCTGRWTARRQTAEARLD